MSGRSRSWGARWGARGAELLDRVIAPSIVEAGGEQLRRVRVMAAILCLATVLYPPWLLFELWEGQGLRVALAACSWMGSAALLWWVHRGSSSERLGHGWGLVMLAPTFIGIVLSDDPFDPHIMTLLATPVALVLLAGGRVGWAWCGMSMLGFAVIALRVGPTPSRDWIVALAMSTVSIVAVAHAFEAIRQWASTELVAARDQAAAAAEVKGRFLANMSHEIRTPMNGVLGMLGVLLETSLDRDQYDYASTAYSSGLTLLSLINDVLDFSKLEAGRMVLQPAPFDLLSLVEDLVEQVAVEADGKGLELVLRYAPTAPLEVQGDRGRVRQVLLNLVGNAIKYTEQGHVLVTIESVEGPEGPAVRCAVEDSGIGIPAAELGVVFEEFEQLDGSSTRARGGTGLGLSIVRELVTLMGGELGVESIEGQGSTFWMIVPLDPVPPSRPPMAIPSALAGATVLVVDDQPLSRRVLCERLEGLGLVATPVPSGSQALEELRTAAKADQPHRVVLVDYGMPRMDGLELARAIRAEPTLGHVAVILLATATHRASAEQLREVEAAMLIKPVRSDALLEGLASISTPKAEPVAPAAGPRVPAPHRVLVVDDNVINQKVARKVLQNLGCRVDVVGSGRAALARIESEPYDIVLMDVQMPEMDGLETTAELRRREGETGSRLPIVALTAHAMPGDRARCIDAGMDDYVSKPVTRASIQQVLDRLASHLRRS